MSELAQRQKATASAVLEPPPTITYHPPGTIQLVTGNTDKTITPVMHNAVNSKPSSEKLKMKQSSDGKKRKEGGRGAFGATTPKQFELLKNTNPALHDANTRLNIPQKFYNNQMLH